MSLFPTLLSLQQKTVPPSALLSNVTVMMALCPNNKGPSSSLFEGSLENRIISGSDILARLAIYTRCNTQCVIIILTIAPPAALLTSCLPVC